MQHLDFYSVLPNYLPNRELLNLPRNPLKDTKKDVSMMLLENEHWPQPHARIATSSNMQSVLLRHAQKFSTPGRIKGDESAEALPTEVLESIWVLFGERLDVSVEVVTDRRSVLE